jgi:hypothetical protein
MALDFESFADSTGLTNQYAGFFFANNCIWTAELSQEDLGLPLHSGTNVVLDLGAPLFIAFTSPVLNTYTHVMEYLIDGATSDGWMPPNGSERVRCYLSVTNEQVRNAKIDLVATYANQFVDGVQQ